MYMDALRGYSTCLSLAGRSPPDRSSSKYLRYPPRKPLFTRPFSTTSHPSIHPSTIPHPPSPIPSYPVISPISFSIRLHDTHEVVGMSLVCRRYDACDLLWHSHHPLYATPAVTVLYSEVLYNTHAFSREGNFPSQAPRTTHAPRTPHTSPGIFFTQFTHYPSLCFSCLPLQLSLLSTPASVSLLDVMSLRSLISPSRPPRSRLNSFSCSALAPQSSPAPRSPVEALT